MGQDMELKSSSRVYNILNSLTEQDILTLIEEDQLLHFCNILTLDLYQLENTSSKFLA
jgi:hypothetical protein